jgi:hypothetical protein
LTSTFQSSQEKFIALRERVITEEESSKNKIDVGWYSKHDMVTVLKWNTILI